MPLRRVAPIFLASLVASATVLFMAQSAAAGPILVQWTATVTNVSTNAIPQAPAGVAVADIMSGSFVYDSEALPTSSNENWAWYQLSGGWTLNVDGHFYTGTGFDIFMSNDESPMGDRFLFMSSVATNDPEFKYSYLLDLRDFEATKWSSLALPLSFDLTGFDYELVNVSRHDTTFINISGDEQTGTLGNVISARPLDSFTTSAVPDPGSTLLLLGMGLVGLRAWQKRLG